MEQWIFQFFLGVSVVSNLLNGGTQADKPVLIVPIKTAPAVVSSSLPMLPRPKIVNIELPILPADLLAAGGCESNNSPKNKPRQFDKDGKVIKHFNYNKAGILTSTDYGAFQINSVHIPEAKKLGLDFINSKADNYKMALIIYRSQGIGAWAGYDPKRGTCSYY